MLGLQPRQGKMKSLWTKWWRKSSKLSLRKLNREIGVTRDFFNSRGLSWTRCWANGECARIHMIHLLNEGKLSSNLKIIEEIQSSSAKMQENAQELGQRTFSLDSSFLIHLPVHSFRGVISSFAMRSLIAYTFERKFSKYVILQTRVMITIFPGEAIL